MAFSPDGRTIAVGSYIRVTEGASGEIILWEPRSRKVLRRIKAHRGNTDAIAFAADGRTLIHRGRRYGLPATGGAAEGVTGWSLAVRRRPERQADIGGFGRVVRCRHRTGTLAISELK